MHEKVTWQAIGQLQIPPLRPSWSGKRVGLKVDMYDGVGHSPYFFVADVHDGLVKSKHSLTLTKIGLCCPSTLSVDGPNIEV